MLNIIKRNVKRKTIHIFHVLVRLENTTANLPETRIYDSTIILYIITSKSVTPCI